jgi:hypothetical protein
MPVLEIIALELLLQGEVTFFPLFNLSQSKGLFLYLYKFSHIFQMLIAYIGKHDLKHMKNKDHKDQNTLQK